MTTEIERVEIAQDLYGSGWLDLPEFAREAGADFISYLLNMDAADIVSDAAADFVHEFADGAVPVYNYQLYAVLADPAAVRAVEYALDDYGADAVKDADGVVSFARLIGVGMYGAIAGVCSLLVAAVECGHICWGAFGLDDDAAEIAARLLPEWSGTIAELVEAAVSLEVAR